MNTTKNIIKNFFVPATLASIIGIVGTVLVMDKWIGYGLTIFFLVPLIIGFKSYYYKTNIISLFSAIFGLFGIAFPIMIISGLEGVICLLMASPILLFFILLGYLIALFFRRITNKRNKSFFVFSPLVLFVFIIRYETEMMNKSHHETVETTIVVSENLKTVFDTIIEVDNVKAEKKLLHYLGLPQPVSCQLDVAKIGGTRYCQFKNGHIIETITDLKRGEYLEMDVTTFALKDRPWLKVLTDAYYLKEENGIKTITRKTTHISTLTPRWYWSFFEHQAIGTEHDIVFDNLLYELQISNDEFQIDKKNND